MNAYENKNTLAEWLESKESEDYRDMNFAYSFFDLDGNDAIEALNGGYFEAPYWMESHEDAMCQYVPGYYEPMNYGDIVTIEGEDWEYYDGQSLTEEVEHQADNGECVYEYRGYSYLRIFRRMES